MKKNILFILAFLLFSPSVLAASFYSDYSIDIDQNQVEELAPVKIISTISHDIVSEYGIHIILEPQEYILWQKTSPVFNGSAVDSGKILQNSIVYSKDYKGIYIPVISDFEIGDTLNIQGLALRAYDDGFSDRYLGLDLNDDLIPDLNDLNSYEVTGDIKTDEMAPYPVQDVTYQINPDKSIALNWNAPEDYDYDLTSVSRIEIVNGQKTKNLVYNGFLTDYVDSKVVLDNLEALSYEFIAIDSHSNWSDPVEVVVDLKSSDVVSSGSPLSDQQPQTFEEDLLVEKLKKKLNYFYLRYEADCNSEKVNDYSCLWARIRLIHAQELTRLIIVSNLTLSQADLGQMAARQKWPEMRYQVHCQMEGVYDPYCERLKEDLDRLHYFLDPR